MVTYPTYAHPVEFEVIARTRNFKDMHPTMRERLQALMEDSGGKVGWGQGVRTPQQQLQLFLQRHSPDPNGKIIWNGERYSRHTGAPAAPPGSSMHELGLAADMAGDFAWLGKNVGRFGLMTFADVNNEPWHVQPAELPRGRRQYEQQAIRGHVYVSSGSVARVSAAAISGPITRWRRVTLGIGWATSSSASLRQLAPRSER